MTNIGIDNTIGRLEAISLGAMDEVKLMNRTDRKYWFGDWLLADLLDEIASEYYILEIGGERNLPYSTTYYDTTGNEMYNNHHRGKRSRYKIRRRNYISTASSFLEIKFKNNKGRTIKVRQPAPYQTARFERDEAEFISRNTPYEAERLEVSLKSEFRRLMLVSRSMDERCTIDSQLHFEDRGKGASLENLVVLEVKSDSRSHSRIVEALKRRRLKPSGFSKYCVGRSLVDSALKQNNFKRKHREIEKVIAFEG